MHVLQREYFRKEQWQASRQWFSARVQTKCYGGGKGADVTQVWMIVEQEITVLKKTCRIRNPGIYSSLRFSLLRSPEKELISSLHPLSRMDKGTLVIREHLKYTWQIALIEINLSSDTCRITRAVAHRE